MSEDLRKKKMEEQVRKHNQQLWKLLKPFYSKREEELKGKDTYTLEQGRKSCIDQVFRDMAEDLAGAGISDKPSDRLKKNWKHVLEIYIPKAKWEELLYILDKQCKFCYTVGYYRRTVRSAKHWFFEYYSLRRIFESYYHLSFYGDTMEYYYSSECTMRRMELEETIGRYNAPAVSNEDVMIAAELDFGRTKLAQSIEDILMSENNTNIVTTNIIRGIVKSDNTNLHKILGDFLLAARLQEGVRQAVCENMDAGTTEAFLTCFQVITDNDLNRFSAVKRAVATWTGLCDEQNLERISNKILVIMNQALRDSQYVQELLKSNDSIELYIGLWAQGFYEVEVAMASCKKLIEEGTKNQRLVVSYYNRAVQNRKFAMDTAKKMLEASQGDTELCAAFLPTYMAEKGNLLYTALYGNTDRYVYHVNRPYVYEPIPYTTYFESSQEARHHFELLYQLKESVPQKGHVYSPCIFPWYSVEITPSVLVENMAIIAYMLQENDLIDRICPMLPEISNVYDRTKYVRLFLHEPKTELQRQTLLKALADKATDTRKEAFTIVSEMELTDADYELIRPYLKYKASDIRKNVLMLLEKQRDNALADSIHTLLEDKKEEMRLGGLDLLMRLKKDESRQQLFAQCKVYAQEMKKTSDKENIILAELTGNSQADSVLELKGYGLYNPDAPYKLPKYEGDPSRIVKFFNRKKKEMYALLDKLEELYTQNANLEYKDINGEEVLLGNRFAAVAGAYDNQEEKDELDKYPFPKLWREFYQEHIKDFATLVNLKAFIRGREKGYYMRNQLQWFRPMVEKIYGKDYLDTDMTKYAHINFLAMLVNVLYLSYKYKEENEKLLKELSASLFAFCISEPLEMSQYTAVNNERKTCYYAMDISWFNEFDTMAKVWKTDEEFDKMFVMCANVNQFYGKNVCKLTILHYVKAYVRNLISIDNVYQGAFDFIGLSDALSQMSAVVKYNGGQNRQIQHYIDSDGEFEQNKVLQTALEIYWNIVEMILKVELNRSEMPTKFSYTVNRISKVRGMQCFIDILTALGNDTLERSVYYSYYGNQTDKRTCLSHLLSVSEPMEGEDGKLLKKMLKGKNISDKRLVEAAMYNFAWIDCIEEYLGWTGFKSGVYYFTAHMNERFSDKTQAIIAKYTPLTAEELNDGAFDLNWFLECSKKLGEKRFKVLYDSAKYISDSNKHTRARKYADAVLEKISAKELEEKISDKRNKDLLMSYPLVPLKNKKEVLHRYDFLQKFLKESKQFGAQRRASEAKAVSMGMQNLAMRSGYADVTRLTLNMETEMAQVMKPYFEWQQVEDVKLKIVIGKDKKPCVVCEKNSKTLKSIPAKLKKNPKVVEINDVYKQLREQHRRAKAMMEQFMEDGVEFTAQEMANLQKNPVIQPILKDLVYVSKDLTGFLNGMMLTNELGEEQKLTPKKLLRIAHPFDLWSLGVWHSYQKILFDREVKQPFKQVFRELYVKTEEEADRTNSLRYAGNQIQPRKTVACLKNRRWVADYEEGLQKIYYDENIVARIYALADWFAPSDIEAPTLEWVEFSNRKTFKPICIKDVPDRIFSEVMRDVDLAVSVAHAGGVDPQTSHSTMEMRRAIVEFNLPLFGLDNVTFAGNHAVIEGKRGTYTVHLGSGVIFQKGGTQLAVLPVHSQHRGKLFLPFLDEDPKTAEIMSKIVLFAEDMKIKDPYILQQIK